MSFPSNRGRRSCSSTHTQRSHSKRAPSLWNSECNTQPAGSGMYFAVMTALCLVFCALWSAAAFAQNDVVVSTQVKPPYSPYLSDYVGFDNKIVVTLQNTKPVNRSVRLVGAFSGDNGVKVAIPLNFKPAQAIMLAPNQVLMLQGSQLKEYINPDVLTFSGISKQEVVQGNGLPEGNYSFCLQAYDYNSNTALSLPAPSGCAFFIISHYEPPLILQPSCNSTVADKMPQNILFSWTAPAGAPPQKIQYKLKIVEMYPQNTNPNQAIASATDPPFFETTVQTTSFLYGASAPKLEKGKKYAFQVTAMNKPPGKDLAFKNSGKSLACSFTYGQQNQQDNNNNNNQDNQQDNDQNNQQYADPCDKLNCAPKPLASGPAVDKTYTIGESVAIGYFTMKLIQLSSPAAGNLSGQGEIDVPLFKTKLKTTFQNLQVNAAGKVFAGRAIGAYDPGAIVDEKLKNFTDNLQNTAAENVKTVADYVKSKQKYIENFVDVNAQGLPFGWKKPFGAGMQLLNVASVEFAPDGARLNAVLEFPIPEANNKILAFAQKNVCFHPTGFSIDGLQKLTMLGKDVTFPWGQHTDITLKPADGDKGTYVKWGCEGFVSMQIDGEFVFKSSMLQPADGNGPVKARFTFSDVGVWGDMLGTVSMDKFTVQGLKGLSFSFDQITLDFSDSRNPQNMAFPANYEGSKGKDWRGFYFKTIQVTLPDYLKKAGQPIAITLQNALINKLGVTGMASVQPVLALDKGTLGGWAFSIDKLTVALVNNSLTGSGMEGKITLPIAKTNLGYTCIFSNSDQGLKTSFEVETMNDLVADMWASKLQINQGSSISIESFKSTVTVKAVLSGKLTIDDSYGELDLKGVKVNIPDVEFKDFTIQNKKPYITAQYFKFASPQKTFAGFPISINPGKGIPVKYNNDSSRVGLELNLSIGLDGNGQSAISGGTAFTVWAKKQEINGKQLWLPDKATLDSIGIKASVASCDLEGSINLYKGDQVFGDGFRGAIKVTFRPLLKLSSTVQFGTTAYKNGGNSYRYWYVDAMAVMNAGIPVFPGFGIYGFGGGAYYHMEPVKVTPSAASLAGDPNVAKKSEKAGETNTGVVYMPNASIKFGFKATIVMGTMPSPNAFNGDITIEASFFEGGGLNEIALIGNGYFVQIPDPKKRPGNDAVVTASVDFRYSTQKASFDGLIDIAFNLKAGKTELLTGGGFAALHFSKGKWFIKFGEPDQRFKLKVLGKIGIDSYFMIGKNSLPPMPPLPTSPINFQQKLPWFNAQASRSDLAENGSGFVLGQQLSIDTGKLKFLIFYAQIAIAFGYDISILKTDQECENANGKMGLNGWYANGQVYAGLTAAVGIDINLWFLNAEVELFKIGVYAALKAGLPNPTWMVGEVAAEYSALNGLLKGHCSFKFRYGDYCNPNQGDPFGGLKIIADIVPSGGDADVFAFPEASFNLPVGGNKAISVEGLDQDGNVKVSTFRFFVKKFEVVNTKTKAAVPGSFSYANEHMSAIFTADEMFEQKNNFNILIEIRGERIENKKWIPIKKCKNCNEDHTEVRLSSFTTGDAPEKFRADKIVETRPGRMQRYFHLGESGKGFVRFVQYPSNIPAMVPEDSRYKYEFTARFQEVKSGSVVVGETPLEWVNSGDFKGVKFTMPELKKETVYIVQFLRKKVLKAGKKESGSNVEYTTEKRSIGGGQYINVRQTRLNSIKLGDDEFLVYQLAFKTSKYNRFKDKLNDYIGNRKSIKRGVGDYVNTVYATYEGDEPLDWYDLNQSWYMVGSEKRYTNPLLMVEARDLSSGTSIDSYWRQLYDTYYHPILDNQYFSALLSTQYNGTDKVYRMKRQYPAASAYTPGSRLTNGTYIDDEKFPKYAVDISYQGNGNTSKLTNSEINAVYWKDLDNGDGGGNNLAILALNNPNQGGNNNGLNAGFDLKANIVSKLVLRYDVFTTLKKDRQQVYEELLYRYSLGPPTYNFNQNFWTFMRHHAPTDVAKALGIKNPDYWSMNPNDAADISLNILYNGLGSPRTISFQISDGK